MSVVINNEEFRIRDIALQPVQIDNSVPEYLIHVGSLNKGEWVYVLTLDGTYGEEGAIHQAEIIIESIAPISFVIN